jgi:hypothetical protein
LLVIGERVNIAGFVALNSTTMRLSVGKRLAVCKMVGARSPRGRWKSGRFLAAIPHLRLAVLEFNSLARVTSKLVFGQRYLQIVADRVGNRTKAIGG